jgi:hypothetical protein
MHANLVTLLITPDRWQAEVDGRWVTTRLMKLVRHYVLSCSRVPTRVELG